MPHTGLRTAPGCCNVENATRSFLPAGQCNVGGLKSGQIHQHGMNIIALPKTLDALLSLSPSTLVSDDCVALAVYQFTKNTTHAQLPTFAAGVLADLEEALADNSPLSMLPNYSIDPSGKEAGCFLAMDLGGLTFRVAVIRIGDGVVLEALRKWAVSDDNKVMDGRFFQWMCDRIHELLTEQRVLSLADEIVTGITWLFSLDVVGYNRANVHHVGKGYEVPPETFGRDLKELIETSMRTHHGVRLNVQCIINDSLAVYAAGAYASRSTKIALVLGTGFNMCCSLELEKLHPDKRRGARLLMNTELSLFGRNLLPLHTKWDEQIDARFREVAFKPHMGMDPANGTIFQPSELLALGRYVPEQVRLVAVELARKGELFEKADLGVLAEPYGLTGEAVCLVAGLDSAHTAAALAALFAWPALLVLPRDVAVLRRVARAVIERAAYVLAACIVAVVLLVARHNAALGSDVSICYVGSVLDYFPGYKAEILRLVNACLAITDLGVTVDLYGVEESSLAGAAIGAAYNMERYRLD